MPTRPTAHLVFVQAAVPLGHLKTFLNRPAHARDTYQVLQGRLRRPAASEVCDFGRVRQVATHQQPARVLVRLQAVDPRHGPVVEARPLGPGATTESVPGRGRYRMPARFWPGTAPDR